MDSSLSLPNRHVNRAFLRFAEYRVAGTLPASLSFYPQREYRVAGTLPASLSFYPQSVNAVLSGTMRIV